MTATTSSETAKKSRMNSFFGRRYITGINSNKKGLIVNCVMQLLGLPVAAVITLILCYVEENYDKISSSTNMALEKGTLAFAIIAIIAFGVSIMSGIPTAMAHFSYLHQKAQADMHYALPLNNKQRFIADYLSGLTVYLGPVIAAVILAFAIFGVGSIFINTEPVWKQLMPIAVKIGVIVFMAMLQLYTVAVFSLTFCGNGFEAGFSICAFNVLIPATILCLWFAITETATFGIVSESILKMNIFTDTSPVGAAAFLLNLDDYFNDSVSTFNSLFAKWLILNVLCTAAYAVAAFFLYKSRKAEDVSKPYVHRSFFYALLTMAVFCVLSLFMIGEMPISAGIVICAVGWFVMEIITRRGFKRFWTAAVGFVAATAAVFGIIGICTVSDGFGASKRIPTADSVKSVTINCGDSYLITSCKFTDEKVIEEAIKLHQQCIDKYYSFDEKDFTPVDLNDNIVHVDDDLFRVTYTTKSGAVYAREYTVSQSMEADLMKAIFLSDEAADVCSEDVGYIDVHSNAQNPCGVNIRYLYESTSVNISEMELEKLCSDLKADILEMTEEELVNGDIYCYLDNGMFVLDSFERTIADLNDFGFDRSSLCYDTFDGEFTIMLDPVFASYTILSYGSRTDVHDYEYNYYMDYDALSEVDQLCNLSSYSYGDMCCGTAYEISCEKPYIDELLDNMTTFIIGQKPIAAIDLYGSQYYLKDTDENRKLIEKLMEYKIDEYDYSSRYEYEYSDDEIYDEIYY